VYKMTYAPSKCCPFAAAFLTFMEAPLDLVSWDGCDTICCVILNLFYRTKTPTFEPAFSYARSQTSHGARYRKYGYVGNGLNFAFHHKLRKCREGVEGEMSWCTIYEGNDKNRGNCELSDYHHR
jgi:hypothetical protein